jgi:flagellum-specific peptidoglycan hydrolase FlgJ
MYGKATYNRIKEFTDKYGFGIAKAIANTGLYFPAVVGQSAYESGYGERIPPNSNNFGGIKYNPNLSGVVGYVESDTTEYINGRKRFVKQKFAKFKDVESGFKAHIQVLMLDRYKKARLEAKSPEEQILMIVKAGYSTTPPQVYLDNMKSLIEASRDYSKRGRIV